jgi:phenylacetate-CoA ligase
LALWNYWKWSLLARKDGYPSFADYRTLMAQERMSADAIAALRKRKTQKLVAECLKNVPYYADLMGRAGLTPEKVTGAESLEVLPLVDKPLIRTRGKTMLNTAADPATYRPHTTSGSTGQPLDFYRGWDYDRLANAAANMRAWSRMGWRPGDAMARFWGTHEAPVLRPGATGRLRRAVRRFLEPPDLLFSAYETAPSQMAQWIPQLRAFRPRYLYGYATILTLFANYLDQKKERLDGVVGIASTAEALFPESRRLLTEVFPGAKVIDIYGSREIPGIASECFEGTMHVASDLVHVEHLPVEGEPDRHRLVITALDNTTFPFIRYDSGDYGSPLEGPCRCGLPFPRMKWGVGKILDSFISPEGKIMYGGWFEGLMYRVAGVHAYQFLQKTPRDIILYIVPTDGFDDKTRAHFAYVDREIRKEFTPEARLRVEIVDAIKPTPAGKHRYVISEVRNPVLDRKETVPAGRVTL